MTATGMPPFASATPLFGREREIERVLKMLERVEVPLVTLTGPGGIGKTSLAWAVARAAQDLFRDGATFVPLATMRDPVLVPAAMATALGLEDQGRDPLEAISHFLAGRETLLVLDNLEHLLAAAPTMSELLRAAHGLTILTTSRAPLRISGEHEWPVGGLEQPAPNDSLDQLEKTASVRLFVARARAIRPDFALTPENAEAIGEICRRLDGSPLALELAAARVRLFSPQAILERLERPLALLSSGARDLPERQRGLRATLDWSFDLLEPQAQRLLVRLGVFVGGFTLEGAHAVTEDETGALEGIAALVEHSLVQAVPDSQPPRFRLLEPVREYALEKLEARSEREHAKALHARHHHALASRSNQATNLRAQRNLAGSEVEELGLEADTEPDLIAALEWALDDPVGYGWMPDLAIMVGRLRFMRGEHAQAQNHLERALALEVHPPHDRGRLLNQLGHQRWARGDLAGSARAFEETLAVFRDLDDHLGIVSASVALARSQVDLGRPDEADERLEEALRLARQHNALRLEANALIQAGRVAAIRHDEARASADLQRALEIFGQLNDEYMVAITRFHLASVCLSRADYAQARPLIEAAVGVFERLGVNRNAVSGWLLRAVVAGGLGDPAAAMDSLRRALDLASRHGGTWGLAGCLGTMSSVADLAGQPELAATMLGAQAACMPGSNLENHSDPRIQSWTPQDLPARLGQARYVQAWNRGAALSPEEAWSLWNEALSGAQPPDLEPRSRSRDPVSDLTPRELEVLRLVAQGLSDKRIAAELGIGPETAKTHVRSILSKLNLPNRVAATRHALEHGLG
jgi:predicted ATPase/DNA-binding CsgD family transcriptional regulator